MSKYVESQTQDSQLIVPSLFRPHPVAFGMKDFLAKYLMDDNWSRLGGPLEAMALTFMELVSGSLHSTHYVLTFSLHSRHWGIYPTRRLRWSCLLGRHIWRLCQAGWKWVSASLQSRTLIVLT
jgi:hypothetical protein